MNDINAPMSGKLTTHVLDTAHGQPAAGMEITLWLLQTSGERTLIKQILSNQEGRADVPLLSDGELQLATYELVFAVGDYFNHFPGDLPRPYFLDKVPIRFGIADVNAHYHVPLLVSPWSYSTYRGS